MVTYHGTQAKVAVKTADTVAYTDADGVTSLDFSYDQDVQGQYDLGSRMPQQLDSGNVKITGSITRRFETGNFSATGMTFFAMATGSTAMFVALYPEGDAAPEILVLNAKFSNYKINTPQNGPVTESCSFEGLTATLTE